MKDDSEKVGQFLADVRDYILGFEQLIIKHGREIGVRDIESMSKDYPEHAPTITDIGAIMARIDAMDLL